MGVRWLVLIGVLAGCVHKSTCGPKMLPSGSAESTDPSALATLPNLRVLGLAETKLSKTGIESLKTLAVRGIDIVR